MTTDRVGRSRRSDAKPPARPLTDDETRDLVAALPWIRKFCAACSRRGGGRPLAEDLASEAILAVYEMASHPDYDPTKGTLIAFARRRLRGRVLDVCLRERKMLATDPVLFAERGAAESQEGEEGANELGGPSVAALHRRLDADVAARAVDAVHVLLALAPEEAIERTKRLQLQARMDDLRSELPERDQQLLAWSWDEGLKGEELAKRVGKSRPQADRYVKDARARLHARIAEAGLAPRPPAAVVALRPGKSPPG